MTKFLIYFWYEGNADKAKRKLTLRGQPLEIRSEPYKYVDSIPKAGTNMRVDGKFIKQQWEAAELWDSAYFIEMDWADLPDFIIDNGAVIVRHVKGVPADWLLMVGDHTNKFTQR